MTSVFDDLPVLHDQYPVGIDNSRQAVCNNESGVILCCTAQAVQDDLFGVTIKA